MDINERFMRKLKRTDKNGCIRWKGWKNHDGYGKFSVGKLYKFAHRYAWELFKYPIPNGKNVLHHCDVRDCCNVNHLYIGTQQDNIRDTVNRKRRNHKGIRNSNCKLDERKVQYIQSKLGIISMAEMARKFGVSESCIHDIKMGRSWRHI